MTALAVTRLHLARRGTMLVTPLGLIAVAGAITILISVIVLRATGGAPGPDYDPRWNQAMAWTLPGFLVYLSVAAVATTFPLGMSLGSTRRSFVAGTQLAQLALAAYITAVMTLLLLAELATGHWFAGIHAFDVYTLGAGNPLVFAAIVFLGTLTLFSMGSLFGSAYVRYRALGPLCLSVGLGLLLALIALAIGPSLGPLFASFQLWWLAVAAGIVIVLAQAGTYALLRRAAVR